MDSPTSTSDNNNESKDDESSKFYVNFNLAPLQIEEGVPESTSLLPSELVASQCDKVVVYTPFTENRAGVLANIYVTDFRLSITPTTEEPCCSKSRILNDKYELPLCAISEIYYCATDSRKFLRMVEPLSNLQAISSIRIIAKDFRCFNIGFHLGQFSVALTNQIYKFAFPQTQTSLFTLKARFRRHGESDMWPMFNSSLDWALEMRRCGIGDSQEHGEHWRLSQFNINFRLCKSYPEFVVVPEKMLDHELERMSSNWSQGGRFPIWCWSYACTGAALLRSSLLNAYSPLTAQQRQRYYEAVWCACRSDLGASMDLFPFEYDVSLVTPAQIQSAFDALMKLCAIDSLSDYWADDSNWYGNLDRTGWMQLVLQCLQMTQQTVTMLQQGRPVILAETEAVDVGCVVSSLVELTLDGFSRTLRGFCQLVQKQWVALGHPFGVRLFALQHPDNKENYGVAAPTFLLFLDCVSQMLRRHPAKFYFSEVFLVSLWDLALTGLTTSFSSNSLYETKCRHILWKQTAEGDAAPIQSRGSSFGNTQSILNSAAIAWTLNDYYRSEHMNLFFNRDSSAARIVESAAHSRSSPTAVLTLPMTMADLDFWLLCHLRWTPPAQIPDGGGRLIRELELDCRIDTAAQERRRLNGLSATESPHRRGGGNSIANWHRHPQRRQKTVAVTSAYPFANDTPPQLPPALHLNRTFARLKLLSGANTTERSALLSENDLKGLGLVEQHHLSVDNLALTTYKKDGRLTPRLRSSGSSSSSTGPKRSSTPVLSGGSFRQVAKERLMDLVHNRNDSSNAAERGKVGQRTEKRREGAGHGGPTVVATSLTGYGTAV